MPTWSLCATGSATSRRRSVRPSARKGTLHDRRHSALRAAADARPAEGRHEPRPPRGGQGRRRPGRHRHRAAHRPALARPRAARGRARRREDPAGAVVLRRRSGLDTKRIQFTPDLMPGDVSGSLVYDAKAGEFEFREGPVFTNVVLADEINRTPPKTQSALLEAMEERQVSTDGVTRPLPDPFLVAATQNPIEHEGTYTLPEAQLDRFLLKLIVDVPPREAELAVLRRHASGFDPRDLAGAGLSQVVTRRRDPRGAAGRGIRHRRRRRPRLRRRPRPGDAAQPLGAARGQPARLDRSARREQGVGVARRVSRHHPRPRADDARARRGATASGCAPMPSSRACRSMPSSARSCSRPACPSRRHVRHRPSSPPRRPRRGARRARSRSRASTRGRQPRDGSCCARSSRGRMPRPRRRRARCASSGACPAGRSSASASRPSSGCATREPAGSAGVSGTRGSRRRAHRTNGSRSTCRAARRDG